MTFRRIMLRTLIVSILVSGAAWAKQTALPGKIAVQSVSDPHPKLTAGGPAVTVKVNGQNLGLVTGCVVLLNGVVSRDITIALGPATATSRPLTLTAGSGLTAGRTGYQLRMSSRDQVIDIPPAVFVMDVQLVSRTSTAVALPPVTQAYPAPNVDITRTPSEGRVGSEISFWGRDFLPDRFQATIGTTVLVALQITYRSTSQMRARLPEQKMTGPLVVSHGTTASRVQIKPAFTVFGRPVISTVRPISFKEGDWIDITGQDLNRAAPFTSSTSSRNPWLMIADALPAAGSHEPLIVAESWSATANGSSARFRAGGSYWPEFNRLAGKLRLYDPLDRGWTVSSPSGVTWMKGPAFVIDSVYPQEQWNGRNVDFILLKEDAYNNRLIVTGTGILADLRAKMGAVDLALGPSTGTRGEFRIPYTATTNVVQFTREGLTVPSPMPIRVGLWPKWDPTTPLRLKVVLNTEYVIRGWGLRQSTITGLAFSVDFSFSPGLPLQAQILEHSDSQIRFKIVTTGPLPTGYQNYVEFNPNGNEAFMLTGRYQNGAPKSLLTKLFYLATQ